MSQIEDAIFALETAGYTVTPVAKANVDAKVIYTARDFEQMYQIKDGKGTESTHSASKLIELAEKNGWI